MIDVSHAIANAQSWVSRLHDMIRWLASKVATESCANNHRIWLTLILGSVDEIVKLDMPKTP
jgi:hypothetical protein